MLEKKSIEELRAIQEAHEADQRAKKEEEEEKAKARKIQEDEAGGEYYEREKFIGQARAADKDVEKMLAAHIEERMKRSEELKKGEEEKKEELQNMETHVDETRTYLEEIEALVAGKEEKEIAQEVKEELQKAQNDFQKIKKEEGELISHLEKMRAEQVSDEEVSRYRELQDRVVKLNEDIQNIESNPVVIEWLVSEAKGEHQVRKQIFYEIRRLDSTQSLYQNREQSKERSNFLEEVCQTFLDEEFEARGINDIKDKDERLKTMQKLEVGMINGIQGGAHAPSRIDQIEGVQNGEERKNQYTGLLLKSLAGCQGNIDGAVSHLIFAERGSYKFPEGENDNKEVLNSALQKHLAVLNLIRGYAFGMKRHKNDVVRGFENWQRFDVNSDLSQSGFIAEPGGPIRPRKAEEADTQRIQGEFAKNFKRAETIDKQLTAKEKESLQENIAALEASIQESEASLKEIAEKEAIIANETRMNLSLGIQDAKGAIASHKHDKERHEKLLKDTSKIRFRERGRRERSIKYYDAQIAGAKVKLSELEKREKTWLEAQEFVKTKTQGRGTYQLEREIKDRKIKLGNLQAQLESLTGKK